MEVSVIISLVALFVSCLTAWLTWFHRGTIKMTQPTTVFFGPDDKGQSKVFLRTLLYSSLVVVFFTNLNGVRPENPRTFLLGLEELLG